VTGRAHRAQGIRRAESEHAERAPHRPGVTARELLERNRPPAYVALTARELERWLLAAGLATNGDGLLRPTPLALELGAALDGGYRRGP
jgi:hypothetical protein